MAPMEDVEDAWADLEEVLGLVGIVPVTYMNSIAGIKALCGRNNGIVCTSSNAKAALEWAFEQGECMLFLLTNIWAETRRSSSAEPRWCSGRAIAPSIPGSRPAR